MSVNLYEQEVRRHQKKVESEGKKEAEQRKKAAAADKSAADYEKQATRSTNSSSARSKSRQAQSKRDEANTARSKAATAAAAKAQAQKHLHEAETKLEDARSKERRKQRDSEERDRLAAEQKRDEHERRAQRERQRRENARDKEVAELRGQTEETETRLHQHLQAEAPEAINVLFVTASPEDQKPLRLDREVREVQRRVQESEYRNSVNFEVRPATQLPDLIQMLNEVRPDVVHFSGHGSQEALAFENDQGRTSQLENDELAALLHATLDRIRLVVLNSCASATQAEQACLHIDAAIGMDQPIDDVAAQQFAGQLYNAIGFGKSLAQAFDQARLHAQLHPHSGSQLGEPRLHVAPGVDASELYLVKPAR